MAKDTCSVDQCIRPRRKRDWCSMHYSRWLRWGTPLGRVPLTPEERFWRRVARGDSGLCWPWLGYVDVEGYGGLTIRRVRTYAHRVAYELVIGPIPGGLTLDHLCRNRVCCNPAHLEAVTSGVNTLRGNGWSGRKSRQQRCIRGHPLEWEVAAGRRRRVCRECKRQWVLTDEYRAKHRVYERDRARRHAEARRAALPVPDTSVPPT